MGTSNDALLTKAHAQTLNYFQDPYCPLFFDQSKKRKLLPLINRGTWARVHSIRTLILTFLKQYPTCNIISLGAGYDSTFFWLKSQGLSDKACFVEIDYPDVVSKKIKIIKAKPELSKLVAEGGLLSDQEVDTTDYKLFEADVRDIPYLAQKLGNVDKERPTLVITECLLVYLKAEDSEVVLKGFSDMFPAIAFLNYEMIEPNDRFGQQMVENIEMRGVTLLGINDCPSTDA